MARRSGNGTRRRLNVTSRMSVTRPAVKPFRVPVIRRVLLKPVEDRRMYHPLGYYRPARTVSGHPSRPLRVAAPVARSGPVGGRRVRPAPHRVPRLSPRLQFPEPFRTIICARRRMRREVLMALGLGNGRARKRRNWFTEVKC